MCKNLFYTLFGLTFSQGNCLKDTRQFLLVSHRKKNIESKIMFQQAEAPAHIFVQQGNGCKNIYLIVGSIEWFR